MYNCDAFALPCLTEAPDFSNKELDGQSLGREWIGGAGRQLDNVGGEI